MECQFQPTDTSSNNIGMDFGWHPDVYSKLVGTSEFDIQAANPGLQSMSSGMPVQPKLADSLSPLTQFEPSPTTFDLQSDTMDPTALWPASMDNPDMSYQQLPMQAPPRLYGASSTQSSSLSSSPVTIAPRSDLAGPPRLSSTPVSTANYRLPPSVQANTPASTTIDSAVSASPGESQKTLRARHAANQRHNKARQARKDSQQTASTSELGTRAAERKQRHREKNKVAAAKCRSRQRKQVQTIQEKGTRLSEKNTELKTMIQELRGELNGLRSMALDHQECDCSVARYNHSQAERVVREYRSSCLGQGFGGFGGPLPVQQSFQVQ